MSTVLADGPVVRVRAAPACDPPYDDERQPDGWVTGGDQLVLDLRSARTVRPGRMAGHTGPAPALPPGALAGASPSSKAAAGRFALTCVEIFNGYRPAGHARPLSRLTTQSTIVQALAAGSRRVDRVLRTWRAQRPAAQAQLRRVRVCEPRAGIAEAVAVISTPTRTWALAFRIERHQGSWLCTTARLL